MAVVLEPIFQISFVDALSYKNFSSTETGNHIAIMKHRRAALARVQRETRCCEATNMSWKDTHFERVYRTNWSFIYSQIDEGI